VRRPDRVSVTTGARWRCFHPVGIAARDASHRAASPSRADAAPSARAPREEPARSRQRGRARGPRANASPRNRTHRGGLASCAERRGGETHRRDRHRGAARGREGRGRGARDGAHRGLAENLRDTTHGSSRRAEGVSWCARSGGVDGRLGWWANSFRFFRAPAAVEAGSVTQEAARGRERPEP
jgi:hypothetical protein